MSGANRTRWVKGAGGTILLAAAVLVGTGNQSFEHAYRSPRGFVGYFRSIEKSTLQEGLWERVALSLVLASADSPEPVRANEPRKLPSSF
jgi:hypothetical protein